MSEPDIKKIIIIIIAVLVFLLVTQLVIVIFRKRDRGGGFEEMEGHEFEHYCASLLVAVGFMEVMVTKGSGDFGADILAEKDGVTYAIQCKCYNKPVGVQAVMEAYAGRDYYDRMVGVVMSNQYFTAPAAEMARKLKIMLWDQGYLDILEAELREQQS